MTEFILNMAKTIPFHFAGMNLLHKAAKKEGKPAFVWNKIP